MKCSIRVWEVTDEFLGRVRPKTLKLTVVASSVTFHVNGYHNDRLAPCQYSVTGWGVMS